MSEAMTMIIAGGGTGGHLFPGIALAEELRSQGVQVIFVGTSRGIEAKVLPREGWPLELIDVGGLRGGGVRGALRNIWRLPRSIWQSRRLLKRYRPSLVIGVGGYAAGPVGLAAWLWRRPLVILEQNSIPGFTNKVLGKLARRVYLSFAESARFFPRKRARLVGNPVRGGLVAAGTSDRPERPFVVFIFGGSQGARAINLAVMAALPLLRDVAAQLHVIHQTGEAMVDEVKAAYRDAGLEHEVYSFIEDMAAMYRRAHVVVARAGATSIAELTLCGKASILIPYPFAADNHQEHNARALDEVGAAILIPEKDLSPDRLARVLRELLSDPARLAAMEEAATGLARPSAGHEIAAECMRLARGEPLGGTG